MKTKTIILSVALIAAGSVGSVVLARGFGGFHGGGGFHAGGFSGGGFHYGGGGGFHYGGGGFDRSSFGGFDRSSYGGLDRSNFGGDRVGQFGGGAFGGSLNRGQLNSFLGLPTDGGFHSASGAFGASGFAANSYGAAAGRAGAAGHVWTGPNGTTIAHGTAGAQGIAAGPGGFAGGGGIASGTAVKTANGNVYTHGAAAGRGIAAGPNDVVAGGFATGGTATGSFGRYSSTYIHAQGVACNRWCMGAGIFRPSWCAAHPWGWCPAGYTAAAWATAGWRWATWAAVGAAMSYDTAPAYYDYGNNITVQNGDVYYGSDPVATQQQYYQEAANIAGEGSAPNAGAGGDWLPLGVFGLMAEGQKTPEMIFQLAVDKQGIVKGNYYDQVSDTTVPVHGAVNKKNQRIAWQIGANKNLVVETGLYNLTQSDSTALVHYGPDDTKQFALVRMKQPDADTGADDQ